MDWKTQYLSTNKWHKYGGISKFLRIVNCHKHGFNAASSKQNNRTALAKTKNQE